MHHVLPFPIFEISETCPPHWPITHPSIFYLFFFSLSVLIFFLFKCICCHVITSIFAAISCDLEIDSNQIKIISFSRWTTFELSFILGREGGGDLISIPSPVLKSPSPLWDNIFKTIEELKWKTIDTLLKKIQLKTKNRLGFEYIDTQLLVFFRTLLLIG